MPTSLGCTGESMHTGVLTKDGRGGLPHSAPCLELLASLVCSQSTPRWNQSVFIDYLLWASPSKYVSVFIIDPSQQSLKEEEISLPRIQIIVFFETLKLIETLHHFFSWIFFNSLFLMFKDLFLFLCMCLCVSRESRSWSYRPLGATQGGCWEPTPILWKGNKHS